MRRKSAIYTHRREDDYHCHLYVGVSPPRGGGGGLSFRNSPMAIPSGSPFRLLTWQGFSSTMWHEGAETTAIESAGCPVISCTVMLGGGDFLGELPIVGGGLFGDNGISCLPPIVGECCTGEVGMWGGGPGVTCRRGWAWGWGARWFPSSSISGFDDGECWATCGQKKKATISQA